MLHFGQYLELLTPKLIIIQGTGKEISSSSIVEPDLSPCKSGDTDISVDNQQSKMENTWTGHHTMHQRESDTSHE